MGAEVLVEHESLGALHDDVAGRDHVEQLLVGHDVVDAGEAGPQVLGHAGQPVGVDALDEVAALGVPGEVVGDEVRVAHVAGAQRREAPVGVGDGLAESGPGGPVALRPAGGLARPVDDDVQRRGDQRVAVDANPGRGRRGRAAAVRGVRRARGGRSAGPGIRGSRGTGPGIRGPRSPVPAPARQRLGQGALLVDGGQRVDGAPRPDPGGGPGQAARPEGREGVVNAVGDDVVGGLMPAVEAQRVADAPGGDEGVDGRALALVAPSQADDDIDHGHPSGSAAPPDDAAGGRRGALTGGQWRERAVARRRLAGAAACRRRPAGRGAVVGQRRGVSAAPSGRARRRRRPGRGPRGRRPPCRRPRSGRRRWRRRRGPRRSR